jgi:hypothetical protein
MGSFRKLKRNRLFDILFEARRHRNSQKLSRLRDSLTLFQALQYILKCSDPNLAYSAIQLSGDRRFLSTYWRMLAAISRRLNASNSFVPKKDRRNAFGVINEANRGSVLPISRSLKTSRFAAAALLAKSAI